MEHNSRKVRWIDLCLENQREKGRNDMKASKPHEKGGKFCGDGFFLSRKEIGDLEKNKWRNGENFSYTKIEYFVSEENEKKMQGGKHIA